ncbi:MAG TPA: hypothetical protein VHL11_19590 [Phototrophicaceae bacterium]|jgi:hypothetical protein|nr:hypothetical protein [Phototrophicaceae bacterium]
MSDPKIFETRDGKISSSWNPLVLAAQDLLAVFQLFINNLKTNFLPNLEEVLSIMESVINNNKRDAL